MKSILFTGDWTKYLFCKMPFSTRGTFNVSWNRIYIAEKKETEEKMQEQKATLTSQEKRNVKLIKQWANSWENEASRMVDEIYADSTEVFLPLQKMYMLKTGKSKANWRAVEVANQKLYTSRQMKLITVIPRGDTVAVEVMTTETNLIGRTKEGYFAAFLKFDKDGRIVSDHSYMINADRTPDPERAHTPEIKKLMLEFRAAHQRVMAVQ